MEKGRQPSDAVEHQSSVELPNNLGVGMAPKKNTRPRSVPTKGKTPRYRALLILSSVQFRRKLAGGLARMGYDAFQAQGRADGLPLLYQVHPQLILLEATDEIDETVETFSRIRIFTDVPIILLDHADPRIQSLADQNALVLTPPISQAKILRAVRAMTDSSLAPPSKDTTVTDEHKTFFTANSLELEQQLLWLRALLSRIRTVKSSADSIDPLILEHLCAAVGAEWVAVHATVESDRSIVSPWPVVWFRKESSAPGSAGAEQAPLIMQAWMAEAVRTQRVVPYDRFSLREEQSARASRDSVGLTPCVIAPLIGRNQVHGTLTVVRPRTADRDYTPTELQVIMMVAEALALAVDDGFLTQQARQSSIVDAVTGIYGRAYAERILAGEKARTQRYGRSFAVVQLNWVNGQRLREAWGDPSYVRTLRQIADTCKSQVRASDVVARWAEETFQFVLPETDALQAQNVASRLGQAIQARFVDYSPEARPEFVTQVIAG